MSGIYPSDYNSRTQEMKADREQRARETALVAAAQIMAEQGYSVSRADATLLMAKKFEQYIKTGR